MNYSNPFSLLQLDASSLSEIDSTTIRKAKKQLLAELELEDSVIIDNVVVNKNDALKVIDELDSEDKKKHHFQIYQNKPLLNFLTQGDESFFRNGKTKSLEVTTPITESLEPPTIQSEEKTKNAEFTPEFIEFVSPYYAAMFDKKLKDAIDTNDLGKVKQLCESDFKVNLMLRKKVENRQKEMIFWEDGKFIRPLY